MNMMALKSEREAQDALEENAVPGVFSDQAFDYGFDADGAEFSEFEPSANEPSQAARTAFSGPLNGSVIGRSAWFRNLSLRGKVHAIFATFFGIGFAMALVVGLGLGELWLRYAATVDANEALYEAVELRAAAGDLRYSSARFLFAGEEAILARQREGYENASARIDILETVAAEALPSFMPAIERLRSDFEAYDSAFLAATTAQAQGDDPERVSLLGTRLAGHGEVLVSDTRDLVDDLVVQRELTQQSGLSYFTSMIAILAVLAALASAVLFMGLRYLSYDFSNKISEITDNMTRLARGERDFEIEEQDRKDEIGEMLRALVMFKRANQQLEIWARERSERADESIRSQHDRERDRKEAESRRAALLHQVAQQFETTVGEVASKVAQASSELGNTASSMAITAEQAAGRTGELSQHMEEANIGATAAAAASDQFALSIGEISRQATSSSEMARIANDATEEADATISALSDSAQQVGKIVELIQTIAQRTNLLALNASIEAARGGAAGRGFAVVASEVKELAMQTSRATEEVAAQILTMQDTTGASVAALRAIAVQVRDLDATSVAIASAVNEQSVAGQDLARNIDLAARGTDQVASRVKDVRALSLSTGAAANQVLSSANELEMQASTLSEQVKTFLRQVRET